MRSSRFTLFALLAAVAVAACLVLSHSPQPTLARWTTPWEHTYNLSGKVKCYKDFKRQYLKDACKQLVYTRGGSGYGLNKKKTRKMIKYLRGDGEYCRVWGGWKNGRRAIQIFYRVKTYCDSTRARCRQAKRDMKTGMHRHFAEDDSGNRRRITMNGRSYDVYATVKRVYSGDKIKVEMEDNGSSWGKDDRSYNMVAFGGNLHWNVQNSNPPRTIVHEFGHHFMRTLGGTNWSHTHKGSSGNIWAQSTISGVKTSRDIYQYPARSNDRVLTRDILWHVILCKKRSSFYHG